jgi:hypothetical protein
VEEELAEVIQASQRLYVPSVVVLVRQTVVIPLSAASRPLVAVAVAVGATALEVLVVLAVAVAIRITLAWVTLRQPIRLRGVMAALVAG